MPLAVSATAMQKRKKTQQFAKVEKRAMNDTPFWLANRLTENHPPSYQRSERK
jgi:hypothetical protein